MMPIRIMKKSQKIESHSFEQKEICVKKTYKFVPCDLKKLKIVKILNLFLHITK